jgi:hypothetical protein
MSRRDRIQLEQLETLDAAFREMLVSCLDQCSRGRWGLFRTFDYLGEARKYWNWPEADRLRELASSIQEVLTQSGEHDPLCKEFLDLCAKHSANDPGEPRLAQILLERIEKGDFGPPGSRFEL